MFFRNLQGYKLIDKNDWMQNLNFWKISIVDVLIFLANCQKKNNTFYWRPKWKIHFIQIVLWKNTHLFYVIGFQFCPPKKCNFLRMPDFYQRIKLSSLSIKYFHLGMVLMEDLWIIQRYIISEDISTKSRDPGKNFLRSVYKKMSWKIEKN